MEETNFSESFIEVDRLNDLGKETLIGWSTACLDEAILFYIDCNRTSIITGGSSQLEEEM
jgi:hypothetical protein